MKKLRIVLAGLALAAVMAAGYSATRSTPQTAKAPDCCADEGCCSGGPCCR